MLQRIQTVYLLLGAVVVLVPITMGDPGLGGASMTWVAPARLALSVLAAAVAVWTIFMFKDRQRQRSLTLVAQIVTLLLLGLVAATTVLVTKGATSSWTTNVPHLAAVVLPAVAYIFFSLARRSIAKDIALVKSMDRLRD